ncbi:hypothetical protein [Nocardia sp. NPDC050175]|uniref:hypothetical protein n=1 Tax=Nocardia sp. NPDC050175 TaxID=3364317 RepID=UPI00379B4F3A
MRDIEFENARVLDTVQAMCGGISRNMRAIAIQGNRDRLTLFFSVYEDNDVLREDIREIEDEIYALQSDSSLTVEYHVYVGAPDLRWPGYPSRRVYMAKSE